MDYDYRYVIFTYILGIFLSGLSVLFDFPLGIFSWTARFSETQQLRIFLKHSQSIISLPYSPCRNFRRFWCNGKSPICPRVLHRITSDLYLSCLGCNSIFFYLINISLVSLQLLEHMLRPLAKIYPMEWRSVLVDFGTPPTEHLFIRVTELSYVSYVRMALSQVNTSYSRG